MKTCADPEKPAAIAVAALSYFGHESPHIYLHWWGEINVVLCSVDLTFSCLCPCAKYLLSALFPQMRLRPVFVISESFCRAHGLPHKRILRPPLFKKAAEVVNYSKLAIRYTTSMTKDMVYGALREVFRGVSVLLLLNFQMCD